MFGVTTIGSHSHVSSQYSRSIYTACFVVWQPRRAADTSTTEPFLLLHREHGTGCRRSWNCCYRRTCFVVIWKHFGFILSTGTKIRIDSVMRPRSSSMGRNTSASVTVTVTVKRLGSSPQPRWCSCGSSSQSVCRVASNQVVSGFCWSLWYFPDMVPQTLLSSRFKSGELFLVKTTYFCCFQIYFNKTWC